MKFKIIHIGKTSSNPIAREVDELYKRIKRFAKIEEVIIPDVKRSSATSPQKLKELEARVILSRLDVREHLILLDEHGKELDSRNFAGMLEKHFAHGGRPITFLSGGAFGFDESIYEKAQARLSLSKMTFSHQLIRLIFVEQLYRAMTIVNGHPYHND